MQQKVIEEFVPNANNFIMNVAFQIKGVLCPGLWPQDQVSPETILRARKLSVSALLFNHFQPTDSIQENCYWGMFLKENDYL